MIGNIEEYLSSSSRFHTFLKSYPVVFKFSSVKRTGVLNGFNVYNELFVKVKNDYYTPVFNLIKEDDFSKLIEYRKRVEKFLKYYKNEHYKDIEQVYVVGSNPYNALYLLLALWVDYDLLKKIYRGIDVKAVDEILWGYYVNELKTDSLLYHSFTIGKDMYKYFGIKELIRSRRFNIIDFIQFVNSDIVPLLYKDGVLLVPMSRIFKDFSVYGRRSVNAVVKSVIDYISDSHFSLRESIRDVKNVLPDFVDIKMFPYYIFLMPVDGKFVLNVYKFNFKTYDFDLVLVRSVENVNYDYDKIKSLMVPISDSSLSSIFESALNEFVFVVDDEYLYLYNYSKDFVKLPLSIVECFEVSWYKAVLKVNWHKPVLKFGGKGEGVYKIYLSGILPKMYTKIVPCNNKKK